MTVGGAGRIGRLGRAAALGALVALVASVTPRDARAQAGVPPDTSAALVIVAESLVVADAGPGESGRMLRRILARPHVVLRGDTARTLELRRDTSFAATVIVLGGDVAVASRVRGDVVVIGGDLFVRPGARIEGRAIAFGGGVYPSTLGVVLGGIHAYRDHTFVPEERDGTIALHYRDLERSPVSLVSFPAFGLHLPEYTRVDGLVLPWGPTVSLAEGGVEIVPTIAWRSHLGAVDPGATASIRMGRRNRLVVEAGRGTFSNDRWIRSNLVNSFTTLVGGVDTRNYFRADRAEARAERRWEFATATLTPRVGARVERGWSVGPDGGATSAPWTLLRGHDPEHILRPNPRVTRGRIASALAGARLDWESRGVEAKVDLLGEHAFSSPLESFTQFTGDLEVGFPTVGTQRFDIGAHAVATGGDAPPQRWAYLGGNGTLLTLDLLEMGGDWLAYVDSRYSIPIERLTFRFVGTPVLTLRHNVGSAGVAGLPTFVQNLGVRLTVSVVRFDYTVDPASRRSDFDVSFAAPF